MRVDFVNIIKTHIDMIYSDHQIIKFNEAQIILVIMVCQIVMWEMIYFITEFTIK